MDVAFGALPSLLFLLFLHTQDHFDINHLVKVTVNSIQLGRDVTAQGRCNFEMVTADRQVHEAPPVALGMDGLPARPDRPSMTAGPDTADKFTMRPRAGKSNPPALDSTQETGGFTAPPWAAPAR
jgi:hypothetical protein